MSRHTQSLVLSSFNKQTEVCEKLKTLAGNHDLHFLPIPPASFIYLKTAHDRVFPGSVDHSPQANLAHVIPHISQEQTHAFMSKLYQELLHANIVSFFLSNQDNLNSKVYNIYRITEPFTNTLLSSVYITCTNIQKLLLQTSEDTVRILRT